MADHDVIASPSPKLTNTRHYGRPTIAQLKTTLSGLNSTVYTAAAMNKMTYNDLVYAIRTTPQV